MDFILAVFDTRCSGGLACFENSIPNLGLVVGDHTRPRVVQLGRRWWARERTTDARGRDRAGASVKPCALHVVPSGRWEILATLFVSFDIDIARSVGLCRRRGQERK